MTLSKSPGTSGSSETGLDESLEELFDELSDELSDDPSDEFSEELSELPDVGLVVAVGFGLGLGVFVGLGVLVGFGVFVGGTVGSGVGVSVTVGDGVGSSSVVGVGVIVGAALLPRPLNTFLRSSTSQPVCSLILFMRASSSARAPKLKLPSSSSGTLSSLNWTLLSGSLSSKR